MKRDLINYLVCPQCESRMQLEVHSEEDADIRTGLLRCNAAHEYPITRFVPRFVDADQYADSFSKQRLYVRRHFTYYRNDRSGDKRFLPSTGFSVNSIRNGISLEAGCGYGRYLDVVQRLGGTIIGVDLSTHSIDLAQDFVGRRPNVHLVQCDLFRLPFPKGRFDNVFSLGVLHHTPKTHEAFDAIVPYVSPGGQISIWVYHPSHKVQDNRWRLITTCLPHSVLYSWCVINQALFSWIRALPGGPIINKLIPGAGPSGGQKFWLRVLSDFDSLSPLFAHTHTEEEVMRWFVDAGLKEVRALGFPTAVTGFA